MTKRTTIYLAPQLHQALKMKAVQMSSSISEVISQAIRFSLKEDAIDLQAIKDRAKEPAISHKTVLKSLKRNRLL